MPTPPTDPAAAVTLTWLWLGYVVAQSVLSGRWWLMLLFDLAPPLWFVVVPLLLAATALMLPRRRWRVLLPAGLALVLGGSSAGLNLAAPFREPGPVTAESVRVVTWNTFFWDQDKDREQFYTYLRGFDADVYLLQEYLHHLDRPIPIDDLAGLSAAFPEYEVVAASELVTLSRLPVLASRPLDGSRWLSVERGSAPPPDTDFLPYWTTKTLRTDILFGDRPVSLYNTHIPVQVDTERSPLTGRFYGVIREQSARRDAAWEALATDLAGNDLPSLLLGDFNSTPAMGELRRLDPWLTRADPTGGSIYPASWDARTRLPLWRIDFAFHTPEVTIDRYRFVPSHGLSDHVAQDLWVRVP